MGGANRLVEYLAVVGPEPNQDLRPRVLSRRDSTLALQPIVSISVSNSVRGDEIDLGPSTKCLDRTVGGDSANLNRGTVTGRPVFLFVERDAKAAPITSIQVVQYQDVNFQIPPGAELIPGNLNKRSGGVPLALLIRRDPDQQPIVDLAVVNETLGEECPPDFVKLNRNLNSRSIGGHTMYLCYRVSALPKTNGYYEHRYQPYVLDRYPLLDRDDFPFPDAAPEFCYPTGLTLSEQLRFPSFFSFVLTTATGQEAYGSCLKYWEQLDETQARSAGSQPIADATVYAPRCMVLISRWPFYDRFKRILMQLYRIAWSPTRVPIEGFVQQIVLSIPVPVPGSVDVVFRIGHDSIRFWLPHLLSLPVLDISLIYLFKCLDVKNIVTVFECMLGEKRIVLCSEHIATLNLVAEGLRCLLFPFEWQCIFIPVLPSSLSHVVQSPVPYLVGLHRSFVDEIVVPDDAIVVDLDRNTVGSSNAASAIEFLGPSLREQLLQRLNEEFASIYAASDFSIDEYGVSSTLAPLPDELREEDFSDDTARLVFLDFFVDLLRDYESYAFHATECNVVSAELHDLKVLEYVNSFPPEQQSFMRSFSQSQSFVRFCNLRSSPNIPLKFIFFDWCICLKRQAPEKYRRKILSLMAHNSSRSIEYLVPDAPVDASNTSKIFQCDKNFPRFNPDLFLDEQKYVPFENQSTFLYGTVDPETLLDEAQSVSLTQMLIAIARSIPGQRLYSRSHALTNEIVDTSEAEAAGEVSKLSSVVFEVWLQLYIALWRVQRLSGTISLQYGLVALAHTVRRALLHRQSLNQTLVELLAVLFARCGLLDLLRATYCIFSPNSLAKSLNFFESCNSGLVTHEFELGEQYGAAPSPEMSAMSLPEDVLPEISSHLARQQHHPESLETQAVCTKCSRDLSGEEIMSSWTLDPDRPDEPSDAICPYCGAHVPPYLVVRSENSLCKGEKTLFRVVLIAPREVLARVKQFYVSTLSTVEALRRDPDLYWNVVWWCGCQALSLHFLVGAHEGLVSYEPLKLEVEPRRPWKLWMKQPSRSARVSSRPVSSASSISASSATSSLSASDEIIPVALQACSDELREAIERKQVRRACVELLKMRSKAPKEHDRGMYEAIDLLARPRSRADRQLIASRYRQAVSWFKPNERDEMIPADRPPSKFRLELMFALTDQAEQLRRKFHKVLISDFGNSPSVTLQLENISEFFALIDALERVASRRNREPMLPTLYEVMRSKVLSKRFEIVIQKDREWMHHYRFWRASTEYRAAVLEHSICCDNRNPPCPQHQPERLWTMAEQIEKRWLHSEQVNVDHHYSEDAERVRALVKENRTNLAITPPPADLFEIARQYASKWLASNVYRDFLDSFQKSRHFRQRSTASKALTLAPIRKRSTRKQGRWRSQSPPMHRRPSQ